MDFEVQRCTRHCATSGRALVEGETFYSVLVVEGAEVRRLDFAAEAWQGPPEQPNLGWWKSQMPTRESKRAKMAPRDVLLQLFSELETQPEQADLFYVLALLLVRHRILRLEDHETSEQGGELMILYSARDDSTHRVPVATPSEARVQEIQDTLARLLAADTVS